MKLSIKNRIDELDRVRAMTEAFGEEHGLDQAEVYRLCLVLEESVSNVILHAFPQTEEHDIGISADVSPADEGSRRMLTVRITDDGPRFDPTSVGEVDTTLPIDKRQIGGLGIHIIRHIMDSVGYERTSGRNILTMTKSI